MNDLSLDAVRKEFAELTGLSEDAAAIASAGQGVRSIGEGYRQLKRIAIVLDLMTHRLSRLKRRLA